MVRVVSVTESSPLLGGSMGGEDNPGFEGEGGRGETKEEGVALQREMGLVSGLSLIVGELRQDKVRMG